MENKNAEVAEIKQDEKVIGVLCHALGMIVIPLIVYLLKKDDSPFLAAQAKQALVWQGAMTIIFTALTFGIGIIATFTLGIGGLLYLALPPLGFVAFLVSIYAAVQCYKGENYEYPLLGSLAQSF